MGMYTGLRFKGIIKKEYREDISIMLSEGDWSKCVNPVLLDFHEVDRSVMIPFGGLSYMPDCWEKSTGEKDQYGEILKDSDGFERYFNKDTGLLCFQCSLKNYNDTIEYFVQRIIPVVCDELIHCEVLYEEWEVSTLCALKNGVIKELDYGIRYSETDCEREDLYEKFDFTQENKYRA